MESKHDFAQDFLSDFSPLNSAFLNFFNSWKVSSHPALHPLGFTKASSAAPSELLRGRVSHEGNASHGAFRKLDVPSLKAALESLSYINKHSLLLLDPLKGFLPVGNAFFHVTSRTSQISRGV